MPSESSVRISVLLDNGEYKQAMDEVIAKTQKFSGETDQAAKSASQSTAKASSGIDDLKKSLISLVSLGALKKFFGDAIAEATDAAKAQIVLENALKNVGMQYKDVAEDIERISNMNAVDDDDVKKIYAYAVSLGVPKQRLSEFVETAYDFSAATGKDLSMAMRTLTGDAVKGGAEWEELRKRFQGAGEAAAGADGGVKALGVQAKNLQEQFGIFLKSALTPTITLLIKLLQVVNGLPAPIKNIAFAITTGTAVFAGLKLAVNMLPASFLAASGAAKVFQASMGWLSVALGLIAAIVVQVQKATEEMNKTQGFAEKNNSITQILDVDKAKEQLQYAREYLKLLEEREAIYQKMNPTRSDKARYDELSGQIADYKKPISESTREAVTARGSAFVDELSKAIETRQADLKKTGRVAGAAISDGIQEQVKLQLSAMELIELKVKLKILDPGAELAALQARMEAVKKSGAYVTGLNAVTAGGDISESQKAALEEMLAVEARIKEIEDERKKIQEELTAAVEASKKTLAELDRESSSLFGTAVWDEFRKRLTGAIGAAVSLGEALNRAMDPDVEETNRKISELRLELVELYKLKDSGATETLDRKNLGDAITKKTSELTELSRVANETGKNLVAAYASVADEVSNMVKSYVSAYQDTMSELSDSIMDTSEKTRAAQSAAVKSTVVELEKQIPYIGWLLAMKSEAIPSYAEVVAEAQSRIQDAMNEYEHAISMGAQQSYSQQMAYYTTYISELKAMEASTEDIEAVEEKIAALKKEQTAQMQEQADLAKEIAGVGATLAGDATDQIAYWENVKSGAEKSMESGKDPTASVNAKNASLEAEIEKNTQLREFLVSQRDQWKSWLTPESKYKDQNQKIADVQAKIDSLNAQIAANNLQAAQYDADVLKYQTLIDEANTQLAVLKRTQLDESADTFEYDQTMSDATDTEKAADSLKYYSDYLEQMKALNAEYDALESDKYAELTALNEKLTMDLSEDEEKTINDQISALRDEIDALTEAEYSLDDIRDIETKINELREDSLDILKEQYGVMSDMGLLDLENYDTVEQIAAELTSQGITGTDLYQALSDMGISNATLAGSGAGTTVSIGVLNSINNNASENVSATNVANLLRKTIVRGV